VAWTVPDAGTQVKGRAARLGRPTCRRRRGRAAPGPRCPFERDACCEQPAEHRRV